MFQIIIILLILFVYVLFFTKIKIELTVGEEIYIDIILFRFMKVKRIKFNEKEIKEIKKTSENVAKEEVENYIKNIKVTDAKVFMEYTKHLLDIVEIDKLDFELNVNVDDYILNAYIVTFINSVVAMLISKNIKKINMENLSYAITSHEKKTKLNLKCIMYGKTANIILVARKVIYYALKLKKRGNDENGKRTSNRKSNGNSDDIARVNG